eukprot:1816645-Rhodomonas_salina.2
MRCAVRRWRIVLGLGCATSGREIGGGVHLLQILREPRVLFRTTPYVTAAHTHVHRAPQTQRFTRSFVRMRSHARRQSRVGGNGHGTTLGVTKAVACPSLPARLVPSPQYHATCSSQ